MDFLELDDHKEPNFDCFIEMVLELLVSVFHAHALMNICPHYTFFKFVYFLRNFSQAFLDIQP